MVSAIVPTNWSAFFWLHMALRGAPDAECPQFVCSRDELNGMGRSPHAPTLARPFCFGHACYSTDTCVMNYIEDSLPICFWLCIHFSTFGQSAGRQIGAVHWRCAVGGERSYCEELTVAGLCGVRAFLLRPPSMTDVSRRLGLVRTSHRDHLS